MYSYEEYRKNYDSLSLEEMEAIVVSIQEVVHSHIEDCAELYDDVVCGAVKYANERAKWNTEYDICTRMEKDRTRTALHDGFISDLNILTRYVSKEYGCDISWMEKLQNNRKRVGDFACYIAFVYGLNAR